MIDELRKNVDSEIEILREISKYGSMGDNLPPVEKKMVADAINSLRKAMKTINSNIPEILEEVSILKKINNDDKKIKLERVTFNTRGKEIVAILNKRDKERFVKELSINEGLLKKLINEKKIENKQNKEYLSPRGYLKASNFFFFKIAEKLVNKGIFNQISVQIKKANLEILTTTYVAAIIFTTLLSFIISFLIAIFFLFFNIGIGPQIISLYTGDIISRLSKVILIPLIIPVITFVSIYFYPFTERNSIEKKIDKELPFAAIHMGAISGSGIAPIEIFKIIGTSKDYPFLGKEIRKVLNQINLYGYDLVTALNNIAKATPSNKLSELFSGLTTTINSGGGLQEFFEKRAETLLIDYRLEREKYTKVAETFMDIYITVVVAAPMILMLLLIMVTMTGFQIGFGPQQITLMIISVIALINIIFLGLLQVKQPGY